MHFLIVWLCLIVLCNRSYALSVETMIASEGYSCETHQVITEDGYILTLHRIPYSSKTGLPKKGPVFILHGLLCSSADFVVLGNGKSLAFLLSDEGYDVWLGNARGNKFSRKHITLDPDEDEEKYWNFSWHEIGIYDAPTMIDYILQITGYESLNYIGHSQGCTAFFVMASEKPEYNKKIRSMHALGPAVYMSHVKSAVVKAIFQILRTGDLIPGNELNHEFLPSTPFLKGLTRSACKKEDATQDVCSNILFLAVGFDYSKLNRTVLPAILQNFPAGCSTKQVVHFAQSAKSGKFCMYDHGWQENGRLYGQLTPPEYPLHKITTPVALYYSKNDWLASYEDVEILAPLLPNLIEKYFVPFEKWNHLDYLYGIGVDTMIYARVIANLNNYAGC